MSLSGSNITHLPTPLQSYILANLASSRPQSINVSLDGANELKHSLPNDLLSVAQSSRELSIATADALGLSATVLNSSSARPLSSWVTALGSAVRAVSLFDMQIAREESLGSLNHKPQQFFDAICEDAINTLNALSCERISLEVLDVRTIPFGRCVRGDVLLQALKNALERSSRSLRELGMTLSPICAGAVAGVNLPALEVAGLDMKKIGEAVSTATIQNEGSTEALMEMLQALDGHANRESSRTSLRELRLVLLKAPPVDQAGSCANLFKAVETLKLRIVWSKHGNESEAKFISSFPNLKCLHWKSDITARHLRMIHEACGKLEELHLFLTGRYRSPVTAGIILVIPLLGDSTTLDNIFIACRGKLRTISIVAKLTAEQLQTLGENNPLLEHLEMEIGRENVGDLSVLLGRCRKLQRLVLTFTEFVEDCLGEQGWQTFSEAVRGASDELCEVSIIVADEREPMEYATEAMVQSMLDIIEFLGERARKVCFEVPMAIVEQRIMIDALCEIARACVTHAKNLEHLTANFILADIEYHFSSDEEEKEMFTRLVNEKRRLLEALPRLEGFWFGGVDEEAEEKLEEIEG